MPEVATQLPRTLRSLLVLRMSALGDVVNALHVLPSLRRAFPEARIGWVVDDRFRDLLECVPEVDDVIVYPRRGWGRALGNPLLWPAVAWRARAYRADLRGRGYEAVLDLQGNFKSAFHLWGCGIPLRIGFDAAGSRDGAHRFANVRVPSPAGRILRAEKFLSLLRGAGVEIVPGPVEFRVPAEADAEVRRFLDGQGLADRRFVVMHPGSSGFGSYKRWSPERFAALARRLSAAGSDVVVTWGPGERALAEAVARDAAGSARVALETSPMARLIALLQRAAVFVGNDSGPLHLASACGTPVVGLYGPKDPGVYGPYAGPRAVLYHPLPCSPCGKRRCDFTECLAGISVEAAAERVARLRRGERELLFVGSPIRGAGEDRCAVEASPPAPGPLRRFRAGVWTWRCVPEVAGPLGAAAAGSIDGLPGRDAGGNSRRRFLRVDLPDVSPDGAGAGLKAFVKVYPVRGVGPLLRAVVGRTQAEVEFRRLLRLHAAGVPVPRPLALGGGPDEMALVLEDLGAAPTLYARLSEFATLDARRPGGAISAPLRTLLFERLPEAVAGLHAAGFVHADLHPGNLLALPDGTVRVIDVHRGIDMSRGLQPYERAVSLAHACMALVSFVGASARVRVVRRYAERAGLSREATRELLRECDRLIRWRLTSYAEGQVRRARRGGSGVWIGPWRGGRARVSTRGGGPDALEAPESVEAVIKDEAGRRVSRVVKGARRLAIKEDAHRGRGAREWAGLHLFQALHLPAPHPAFLAEPRRGRTRLAAEWIDGGSPANDYFVRKIGGGASPAWRREAAWRLGRWIRRLHESGLHHADLKAGNVLARDGAGGDVEFFALDLDRIRLWLGRVPRGSAFANLAQINASIPIPVTRTDRLRCFIAYAARDRELRRDWKPAIRDIMRRTRARRHRWP